MGVGLLTGHKMTGIRMVLQDGVSHSVDSSELAFRQAAVGAMRQTFPQATPTILEPVMSVEVVAPDEFQVRTHFGGVLLSLGHIWGCPVTFRTHLGVSCYL